MIFSPFAFLLCFFSLVTLCGFLIAPKSEKLATEAFIYATLFFIFDFITNYSFTSKEA